MNSDISTQLRDIILPFASNPVWERVQGYMREHPNSLIPNGPYKDEPQELLHEAWWDYFTNLDVKASIVFDTIRALGGDLPLLDGESSLDSYTQEVGIDIEKDTWGDAYKKLCKSTWCADGHWFIWLVHSEFLFVYDYMGNPSNICSSYINHLQSYIH